jgi:hypothetical protein
MTRADLQPDIDVTQRAIMRLVSSLTSDQSEQLRIVNAASMGAVQEIVASKRAPATPSQF